MDSPTPQQRLALLLPYLNIHASAATDAIHDFTLEYPTPQTETQYRVAVRKVQELQAVIHLIETEMHWRLEDCQKENESWIR